MNRCLLIILLLMKGVLFRIFLYPNCGVMMCCTGGLTKIDSILFGLGIGWQEWGVLDRGRPNKVMRKLTGDDMYGRLRDSSCKQTVRERLRYTHYYGYNLSYLRAAEETGIHSLFHCKYSKEI